MNQKQHGFDFGFARAAVSDRSDGNLRIGQETGLADREAREVSRTRFLEAAGLAGPLFTPYLAHGGRVAAVSGEPRDDLAARSERMDAAGDEEQHHYIPGVDALITDATGVTLAVTCADCAPVFLVDPERRAIAVAHAGWRGMCAGVLEQTVSALAEAYRSDPAHLRAWIGPCIGPCHFAVGRDVFDLFPPDVRRRTAAGTFVDLPAACRNALIFAGVPQGNITVDGTCTFCDAEHFFSHRREKPREIEAVLAAIALR